jgi:hypothetical protein
VPLLPGLLAGRVRGSLMGLSAFVGWYLSLYPHARYGTTIGPREEMSDGRVLVKITRSAKGGGE